MRRRASANGYVLHASQRAEWVGLGAVQNFVNKLPRRSHVLKPGLMERRDYRLLTERQHELLKRSKWKRVQDNIVSSVFATLNSKHVAVGVMNEF